MKVFSKKYRDEYTVVGISFTDSSELNFERKIVFYLLEVIGGEIDGIVMGELIDCIVIDSNLNENYISYYHEESNSFYIYWDIFYSYEFFVNVVNSEYDSVLEFREIVSAKLQELR